MRHSKCLSKNARSNMGIGYILFRMPKESHVFLFMISPPYLRSTPIFSTKMRVYRCVYMPSRLHAGVECWSSKNIAVLAVYTEYTGKHDWIFEKMTHGCGHVLSSASYITLVSWEFWGGGGATFRFVTLRQMFSEVFNVPRRYSYCFNNDNNIFFTTIWLYFF